MVWKGGLNTYPLFSVVKQDQTLGYLKRGREPIELKIDELKDVGPSSLRALSLFSLSSAPVTFLPEGIS